MPERLYTDLASWWPLLAPPEDYDEEAVALLMAAQEALGRAPTSWLELGSGAGHLASHLPEAVEVVLVDRSDEMLAVSRQLNPDREHVRADLTGLALDRHFDVVLLHDVVMYLDRDQLHRALHVAAQHLAPGGVLICLPDCVGETFQDGESIAGRDDGDRSARLFEWRHSRQGERFRVDLAAFLRQDGRVETVTETHTMHVYELATWLELLADAGFTLVGDTPGFVAVR